MCRLLLVKSDHLFSIPEYLQKFAYISEHSREFQGHGWGCSWLAEGKWQTYKNINPVWKDNLTQFGKTTLLLAHARSAFRDEGIQIENNMPFEREEIIFIFNGELHGVTIKEEGRIGAEKIFNYFFRFHKGNFFKALKKGIEVIEKKSRYIRAMNIIMSDKKNIYLSSIFNQEADYFTLHRKQMSDTLVICSDPFNNETDWEKIENKTIQVI